MALSEEVAVRHEARPLALAFMERAPSSGVAIGGGYDPRTQVWMIDGKPGFTQVPSMRGTGTSQLKGFSATAPYGFADPQWDNDSD